MKRFSVILTAAQVALCTLMCVSVDAQTADVKTVVTQDGDFSGSLTFLRVREAEELLTTARRTLARGEMAAAVPPLQLLLENHHDSLVLVDGVYRNVVEAVSELLETLTPSDRLSYERLSSHSSPSALSAVLQQEPFDELATFADRGRFTAAGRRAALLLSAAAIDRGDRSTARLWVTFIESSGSLSEEPLMLPRIRQLVNEWEDKPSSDGGVTTAPDVSLTGKSWRVDLGLPRPVRTAINEAVGMFSSQSLNPLLTCRPVVSGDRVVCRDLKGLRCVDLATGEPLWTLPMSSNSQLLSIEKGAFRNAAIRSQLTALYLRRLIRNSRVDAIAADHERVYAIESTGKLMAVDLKTGEQLWSTPDDVEVLGPPTLERDEGVELHVVVQRGPQIGLQALDQSSGKFTWWVPFGSVSRPLSGDRTRQVTACRLLLTDRWVVSSTACGAVVCVDRVLRRVAWAHRLPRIDLPTTRREKADATHGGTLPTFDTWTTAALWQDGDRVVATSPESRRLHVYDIRTGRVLWSIKRDSALWILPGSEGMVILVGEKSVQARRTLDGKNVWTTSTERPTGKGDVANGEVIFPAVDGVMERIRLVDGVRLTKGATDERLRVTSVPSSGVHSEPLRSIVVVGDQLLSQSLTELSLQKSTSSGHSADPASLAGHDQQDSAGRSRWASPLVEWRTQFGTFVKTARQHSGWIILADGVLTAGLEQTGVLKPLSARIADALMAIEGETEEARVAQRFLRQLHSSVLMSHYVTIGNRSTRLDRWWNEGGGDNTTSSDPSHLIDASHKQSDRSQKSTDSPQLNPLRSNATWPNATPTVSEREVSSDVGYLVQVPGHFAAASPWSHVTVEVDRQGRSVWFRRADESRPRPVLLTREIGVGRTAIEFLRAWAPADVLVLRIGTELFAFQMGEDGRLPQHALWPPPGRRMSLTGPYQPMFQSLAEQTPPEEQAGSDTSPGFIDVYGRHIGEVGPVTNAVLCFQQRGNLIALDMYTGEELWRHSRLSVGTRAVGDAESIVLLDHTKPTVRVLRSWDGSAVRTWEWSSLDAALSGSRTSQGDLVAVRDRWGLLFQRSTESAFAAMVDLTDGKVIWSRTLPAGSVVTDAGALGVVILQPGLKAERQANGDVQARLELWAWGAATRNPETSFEVTIPQPVEEVHVVENGNAVFLLVSGHVDDRSLLQAKQLQGGARQTLMNGWLHALAAADGAYLWGRPLANVAFPLDQPRHVPVLIVNDQVQNANSNLQTGRLLCLDTLTGKTLHESTQPLHIYYSLSNDSIKTDAPVQFRVRLKRRTVLFSYNLPASND